MNNEQHELYMQEFYSKPFYLSYSGLNKLLYSPGHFYRHYILQQKEDRLDSFLVDGKVIHCLLLDNNSFNDSFIIMPATLPTGNTRVVIDKVYTIYEEKKKDIINYPRADGSPSIKLYSNSILEVLKQVNLHQSLTDDKKPNKDGNILTGDTKRLEKVITEDSKSYWEFLKLKGNKTLIDMEIMDRCTESVGILRKDPKVRKLLGLDEEGVEGIEIFNEVLYAMVRPNTFGLKGILDNVKIDYKEKIIYINDLKSSGKPLSDFPETIEVFRYWIQAAIYLRLIYENLVITEEWKVIFHFIVIDKFQQVYCFKVSGETMKDWQLKLETKLQEANYHYEKRDYTLPYQFATGEFIL
jgi:hypothetical protein